MIVCVMRFFVCRSRRRSSRSARDVISTLYIDLIGLSHLLDYLCERTTLLSATLAGDAAQMQVFQQFLIIINRNDHSSLAPFDISDELNILRHGLSPLLRACNR